MTGPFAAASPQPRARISGAVYLAYFLVAILGAMLTSRGRASAGLCMNLLSAGLYLAVALLFYRLFRPVSQRLSLVAACCAAAGCGVMALGLLHRAPAWANPLYFFGPYCLLLGVLMVGSRFLPRVLGLLMVMAGIAWLIYLLPSLPHAVTIGIEALGVLAEAALMLWLVAMGVKVEQWQEQAARGEV
jgi:Domain of unknown function (DUF4386)